MIIENSINYTPANAWQCQAQQNPVNVVDCVGDLGANSNVTINIPVFITATDGSTLNNQACVDPKNVIVEYDETDNCSTKSTTIGHVDMTINKTAGTGTVTPGQTESYTLVVTNSGTADATAGDVMVTDDLSSIGLTVAGSPSPSNGFDCSATTSTMVSCTNSAASLAAGSSATITFNATVPTSATGQIVNTASVTASDDTGTANKSAQATVNVGAPTVDLAIQSVTGTPATVSAGQALTYTIQAANLGTGAATSSPVVVHNSLNSVSGLTLVSAVGTNGFTCGALSGTSVDCSSSLGLGAAGTSGSPGATTMITIRFMVDPAAVNPIVLTSTIDPNHGYTQDTNTTNNTAQATTSVSSSAVCSPSPCKDLSTTILGSPNPVASGGTVTYSVTVGNVGSVDLIGKDNTHPAVLEYINLDPTVSSVTVTSVTGGAGLTNPWACDPYPVNPPFGPGSPGTPTTLVCHGDLTQGQGAVINLTATFGAGSGSTITTTVIADPNQNIESQPDALDTDTSAITVQ
jgi:uncharacterized repeat protein (TIGR01451 family)